ncbi:MAG TPA: hypothetical protein VGS19_18620 [Streptosporangiaceae bacterium]|nr:hypothetical protein [Streptosporangiaceae bacterium]
MGATAIRPKLGPFGGFGIWEEPREQTGCGLPNCDTRLISPTDLYCHSHDHFLPLSELTSVGRGLIVVSLSVLIYGSIELTAHLRSVVPVDLSYVLIGLFTIGLPLRKFNGTYWAATLLWLLVSAFSLAFQFTGNHFHTVISTAFLLILISVSAIWAASEADDFSIAIRKKLDGPLPGGASSLVASGLIGAWSSVVVALAVTGTGRIWHGDESSIAHASLVAAACFTAASILAAIAVGFIYGTGRIRRDVPAIKYPHRPQLKEWRVSLSGPTPRPTHNVIDRIAEVAILTVFRTSETVVKASVTLSRLMVNFLLISMYILVRSITAVVNWVVMVLVLTFRVIAAAVAAAGRVIYRAFVSAYSGVVRVTVNVGFPVIALAVSSLLATGAAEETRQYIVVGSPRSLLATCALVIIALLLVITSWMVMASQSWERSLESAQHSASRTAPYALLFVAIGGWLLGLPGTILGYGLIHVGWLTLVSTGLIVAAVLLRPVLNRIGSQA